MANKSNIRGVSFGGALLITIFTVMVLAIFCSLSLVSALADLRLSQKHADFMTDYYTANSTAQEFLAALDDAWHGTANTLSDELREDKILTIVFPINNEQSLTVTLVSEGDTYHIAEYRSLSTTAINSEYTTFLNLFEGEFIE